MCGGVGAEAKVGEGQSFVTNGITKPGLVFAVFTLCITEPGFIAALIAAVPGRSLRPPRASSPAWVLGGVDEHIAPDNIGASCACRPSRGGLPPYGRLGRRHLVPV